MQRLAPVSFFLILFLLAAFSAKVPSGISGPDSGAAQSSLAIGQVQHAAGNDAAGNDAAVNDATVNDAAGNDAAGNDVTDKKLPARPDKTRH